MRHSNKFLLAAIAIPFFAGSLIAQQVTQQAIDSGTKTETAKPKQMATATQMATASGRPTAGHRGYR